MSNFPVARWTEADALFEAALDRPPDERTAFLRARCGEDADLYRIVAALIASENAAELQLGESATDFVSHLLREADRDPPDVLDEGTRIGAYRVEGVLGRGGMGVVYRATRADGTFEKEVALKLVKRGMDTDEVLRRFRQERRILAGLEHPGIARMLDAGAAPDGRPYLVMERVDGRPISEWADSRRLPITERLELFERVCEAVTYAHRHLVVHRDLKPSNILVANDGAVKLLDFGIARLLESGQDTAHDTGYDTGYGIPAPLTRPEYRILTPEYSAPEQLRGEPATTATDVYSLGVVLYELLVGSRPRADAPAPSTAVTPEAAKARGTDAERLRRRISGDIDTLTLAALHADPARRYASAEALLDETRRLRLGFPLSARPDSAAYRLYKFVGRHRAGVAASAVALLMLVGFATVLFVQQRATERERDRAETARVRSEQTASFLEGLFDASDPFADERLDTLRARDLLDRGTATAERELADQPLVQANLLGAIAKARTHLGLYDEAEATIRRAMTLVEPESSSNNREADPLDYAELQDALGDVLYLRENQDDWAELETIRREVLATLREQLGSGDPATAAAVTDLALVLERRGEHAEAERYFREALSVHRAAALPDTMETATTAKNLADLLSDLGQYDEAELLHAESIALRRAYLGDGHPSVAVGLQSLGSMLREVGRFPEAEPHIREALEINRAALGSDHPFVSDNLNLLGSVLRSQGRLDEAADALNEAVARTRAFRGDRHPDLAVALNTYSGLLIAQEAYDQAEVVLTEAISIVREALGDNHVAVAFNTASLAQVHHLRGDHDAAVEGYREALRIFEGYYGPGTLNVAMTQGNLGRCLVDVDRFAESEPFLLASLATLTELHGPEHNRITWARGHLADLYEAWEKPGNRDIP